jgi:hypothetical protein
MHIIHPQIPRLMLITLAATVLTILALLVLAPRVGDISFSASSAARAHVTVAPRVNSPSRVEAPAWLTNPLGSPFEQSLALPWPAPSAPS